MNAEPGAAECDGQDGVHPADRQPLVMEFRRDEPQQPDDAGHGIHTATLRMVSPRRFTDRDSRTTNGTTQMRDDEHQRDDLPAGERSVQYSPISCGRLTR